MRVYTQVVQHSAVYHMYRGNLIIYTQVNTCTAVIYFNIYLPYSLQLTAYMYECTVLHVHVPVCMYIHVVCTTHVYRVSGYRINYR